MAKPLPCKDLSLWSTGRLEKEFKIHRDFLHVPPRQHSFFLGNENRRPKYIEKTLRQISSDDLDFTKSSKLNQKSSIKTGP